MRIVSRAEFMKMPAGTVYMNFHNRSHDNVIDFTIEDLCVKDVTTDYNDFVYASLVYEIDARNSDELFDKEIGLLEGKSVDLDFEGWGREGLYDDTKKYVVWSTDEVKRLIAALQKAVVNAERGHVP